MRVSPILMVLIGCVVVLGSLFSYQVLIEELLVIDSQNIRFLGSIIAYSTVGLILMGMVLAFLGLSRSLLSPSQSKPTVGYLSSLAAGLSEILQEDRSSRVFKISSVAYGLLFAIVSGTLMYKSGANFSTLYGISIPSAAPVICCGTFGQMPQLVFYLTQQLALIVVPLNIILLFVVSWLVGLNSAIVRFAYYSRPLTAGVRWSGSIGAIIGLFTVCPTCAGFFLLGVIGLTGGVGLALPLSSLQVIFLAVGFPVLLIAPLLASSKLTRICVCPVTPPQHRDSDLSS